MRADSVAQTDLAAPIRVAAPDLSEVADRSAVHYRGDRGEADYPAGAAVSLLAAPKIARHTAVW